MTTVLLYTGGLDSYLAWRKAEGSRLPVRPLWVDLGQPYADAERQAITRQGVTPLQITCRIMGKPGYVGMEQQIVPGRNLLLATIAASFGDTIWLCSVEGERHPYSNRDKSDEWELGTSAALSYSFQPVRRRTEVVSPWAHLTKREVVELMLTDYGVTADDLALTHSCYERPYGIRCGACKACLHRFIALSLNGVHETHDTDPRHTTAADNERREALAALARNDYRYFSARRARETLDALC